MSVAGVRGAITLAGVLTLPLVLNDGTPFPARDLAIVLAAGVILLSMLIASVALPMLLKGLAMPPEPSRLAEVAAARIATAHAAIRAIEGHQHALAERDHQDIDRYTTAGEQVMDLYRQRIDGLSEERHDETRQQARLASEMHLVGIKAERRALLQMLRQRRIDSAIARKLTRELDLSEARHRG
jgi:CPA1 family monovalent cation:H+ antiporter